MKITLCFVLFFVALAAADELPRFIPVLERTEKHEPSGAFELKYLSGDGTRVSESGTLIRTLDGKGLALIKEGEYSFTAPDGQIYRTSYVADSNGFRAKGDHLPVSVVA